MKVRWGADHSSTAEGVDAAISAWAAGGRSRVLGQESTKEEEKLREGFAGAAKEREFCA